MQIAKSRHHGDDLTINSYTSGLIGIHLSARRVFVVQGTIVVAILLLSVTAKCFSLALDAARFPGLLALLDKFDVNGEMNLPSWWSSLQLFAAAVLLAITGYAGHLRTQAPAMGWLLLAVLFLGLSLEETAAVRDLFNPALRRWLGASGFFHFAWVIPGALFVATVGACFLRFLIRLDTRMRTLFLCAGGLYVAGALGLETVGGLFTSRYGQDHLAYIVATTLEEGMEMCGVALFIYALMGQLQRSTTRLELVVSK